MKAADTIREALAVAHWRDGDCSVCAAIDNAEAALASLVEVAEAARSYLVAQAAQKLEENLGPDSPTVAPARARTESARERLRHALETIEEER